MKSNLKEGLGYLGKIGSENLTLPILKNFLIEANDGKLKFSATNLEMAISGFIPAKITKEGSLTVPLNIVSSIINNLQNERIDLEVKGNNLIIKTENYQAKIQGIKKEEFPIIPKLENKDEFIEIDSQSIKNALLQVMIAAQISGRPELNGVLFDFQIGILKLAATDSFRLAEKTITDSKFKTNIEKKFKTIIPIKTIQEIIRILPDKNNEKVKIFFDSNQVLFKTEKFELISRVINGEFPDYQAIIPNKLSTEININKEELLNALKLTSSFSDRTNEIKIIVKEGAKNMEIFSSSPTLGENQYLIPAKITGEPLEIIFNWRYLIEGVKNMEFDNIFIGLNGSGKPSIVKPNNNQNYFYILMPIKGE